MLDLFSQPETWVSLLTLSAMEIVLGIDNIVFISILTGKLPQGQQDFARKLGLGAALLSRLLLLFAISWVMGLTAPLFSLFGHTFSGRDLILFVGGLFLVGKATHEIYGKLEVEHAKEGGGQASSFAMAIVQIGLLDIVFSLDSVITAIGMAKEIAIMVAAMVIAMGVMLAFAEAISNFVNRHPSMKILALSFLILIGVMLIADSFGQHIPKGYIYSSMAFALAVELVNMRLRKGQKAPVTLHNRFGNEPPPAP
jgi:predicted tellurium resistance membrane protein TerC